MKQMPLETNRHHSVFPRTVHNAQLHSRRIRADERLIFPIDVETHRYLHRNLAVVPILSQHVGMRAFRLFADYGDAGDPMTNIENWQRSIQESIRNPRADIIEREVGELAIHAFDVQKPFIFYGTRNVL